jgi:site-specific DNA-methyltransferase (adenine-specific)
MKPVELYEMQIKNSTNRGDIVLDSFGGSGTAIIACEKLGRCARVVELDPKYCAVIIRRWELFTGRKAVLVDQADSVRTTRSPSDFDFEM